MTTEAAPVDAGAHIADDGAAAWRDALASARLLAVDPFGLGGAVLRARPGPARDRWLAALSAAFPEADPILRAPPRIGDDRLLGGLDLAATLAADRPVVAKGLLADADGGALIVPMAERMAPGHAARIAAALDTGAARLERDGVARSDPARFALVALDEGAEPEERAPDALADRCAFHLLLDEIGRPPAGAATATAEATSAARARLASVASPDALIAALTEAAAALGVFSLRAPLLALRAARAAAALAGRAAPSEEDVALAARLVLAPRATRPPAPEEDADGEPAPERREPPEEAQSEDEPLDARDAPAPERVLQAAAAALPPDLIERLAQAGARPPRGEAGAAGAVRRSPLRGRPIGCRPGRPVGGARLALVETLRAAAPWRKIRRKEGSPRPIEIRREDFRVRRFAEKSETTTVFVVDASGSAALQRLAEAKGAVELLLAEAYVRRDRVALVAFRGTGAELLLPPTRALARAKRALAGLPGGGGTPLALGLDLGLAVAIAERRGGRSVALAILTDGGANVGRDGRGGRAQAGEDALSAARAVRAAGVSALLVDSAPRPQRSAEALAAEMGALYLPLPRADASELARAARAVSAEARPR